MTNTESEICRLIQTMTLLIFKLIHIKPGYIHINIDHAVNLLGGTIRKSDIKEPIVYKTSNESFCIELPENTPDDLYTWLTAIQIGHLFLHMGFHITSSKWSSLPINEPYKGTEKRMPGDTTWFANLLLMPLNPFEEIIAKYTQDGITDLEKVSAYFKVPYNIMYNYGLQTGRLT